VISCGDMHQSFTDTRVKSFFDNFPMFADSFSVVSIYCVARGLGASFLYKCLAAHGGSLQQHGLLVNANIVLIVAALWNTAGHYIFVLWFLFFLSFFSSPTSILSGQRCLPYFNTIWLWP